MKKYGKPIHNMHSINIRSFSVDLEYVFVVVNHNYVFELKKFWLM